MPLLQNGNNKNLSNLSKTFRNEMKIAFTWIQLKLQRTDELVLEAFQSIYVEILEMFHCTINQCYPTGRRLRWAFFSRFILAIVTFLAHFPATPPVVSVNRAVNFKL